MSQDKEIVLVTGASRGIGKAIVLALAAENRVIAGTATTESGAEKITSYMEAAGIAGRGYVLNVTDPGSIDTLMKSMKDEHGTPTILVNNAGITRDNLIIRMKENEWDEIIDTNLTSVFRLSKACLRGMMKARTGRVINITSVVGVSGNAGQSNYAAAKAGIIGFTKSMAREVASRNITVNAVAPGFINTDMTKDLPEEQKQALLGQVPLSRLGEPAEIAATVAFLASSGAAYVTGETINVNGGMYMN